MELAETTDQRADFAGRPANVLAVRVILAACLLSWGVGAWAFDMAPWDAAYDPVAGTRFIPVELWTGADWSGGRELLMRPAGLVFGRNGEKQISGPFNYSPPGMDAVFPVYQRTNGSKRQLFTLVSRPDGTQGMGRVFDSRSGDDPPFCMDEIKMPLGLWREHETRSFDVHCRSRIRHYVITIESLDAVCNQDRKHCLTFHWVVDGGAGVATNMYYTYAPGLGLVHETGNE